MPKPVLGRENFALMPESCGLAPIISTPSPPLSVCALMMTVCYITGH